MWRKRFKGLRRRRGNQVRHVWRQFLYSLVLRQPSEIRLEWRNEILRNINVPGVRGGTPFCISVNKCEKCGMKLAETRTKRPHICGYSYCNQCQTDAPIGHKTCFISPIPPLSDSFVKKTIVFDIEVNMPYTASECDKFFFRLPSRRLSVQGGKEIRKWRDGGINRIS